MPLLPIVEEAILEQLSRDFRLGIASKSIHGLLTPRTAGPTLTHVLNKLQLNQRPVYRVFNRRPRANVAVKERIEMLTQCDFRVPLAITL
jgi:hypothetical protein